MNIKMFVACIVVLAVLGGAVFYYRVQPIRLETSFSLQLTVLSDGSSINGTGFIYDRNINFSVLKWPAFGCDKVDISLQYSANKTRVSPVKFDVLLNLNETEKVVEISDLKQVGTYVGSINGYFDDIKSGSYILTMSLSVDGVSDPSFKAVQSIVFVP